MAEVLEMQLQARRPMSASELAAAMRLGSAAARSLRTRKKRRRWAVAAAAGVLLENPREDAILRAWRPSQLGQVPPEQAGQAGPGQPEPQPTLPCSPAGGDVCSSSSSAPAPPMPPPAWRMHSKPLSPKKPRRSHLAVMSVCKEAAAIAARKPREALPLALPLALPQALPLAGGQAADNHDQLVVAAGDRAAHLHETSGSYSHPAAPVEHEAPPPKTPMEEADANGLQVGHGHELAREARKLLQAIGKAHTLLELDVRCGVASAARTSPSTTGQRELKNEGLVKVLVEKDEFTPAAWDELGIKGFPMDLGDGENGHANSQGADDDVHPASLQLALLPETYPLGQAPVSCRPHTALGIQARERLQPLGPDISTLSSRAQHSSPYHQLDHSAEWPPPRGHQQRSPPLGARSLCQLRTSRRTPRMLSGNRWHPEAGQAASWTTRHSLSTSPYTSPRTHRYRFPDRFSSQRRVEPYVWTTSVSPSLVSRSAGAALSAPPTTAKRRGPAAVGDGVGSPQHHHDDVHMTSLNKATFPQAGASFAFSRPPMSSLVLTNLHSPNRYSFSGEPLPHAMVSARLRGRQSRSTPLLHPSARAWHQAEVRPAKRAAASAQQSRDNLALDGALARPRPLSGAMQHQQVGGAWLVDDLKIF